MSGEVDDEFDELFSFNASTPSSSSARTKPRSSSPIDFGLDDDDDDDNKKNEMTKKGMDIDDDDDDLFGTPPPSTSASKRNDSLFDSEDEDDDAPKKNVGATTTTTTAEELFDSSDDDDDDDDKLPIEEEEEEDENLPLPPPPSNSSNDKEAPLRPRLPSQHDDDFHFHDAGTRDFLEWLDNDTSRPNTVMEKEEEEEDGEEEEEENGRKEESGSEDDMVFVNDESAMTTGRQRRQQQQERNKSNFDFEKEILGESSPPPSKTHTRMKSADASSSSSSFFRSSSVQKASMNRGVSAPVATTTTTTTTTRKKVFEDGGSRKDSNLSSFGGDDFEDIDVDGTTDTTGNKKSVEKGNIVVVQQSPTTAAVPSTVTNDGSVQKETKRSESSNLSQNSKSSARSTTIHSKANDDDNDNDDDASISYSAAARAESPPPSQIQSSSSSSQQQEEQFIEISTPPDTPPPPQNPHNNSSLLTTTPTISFDTLTEAIHSSQSTLHQIRTLLKHEKYKVNLKDRKHLWVKIICGKTLEDVIKSSIADSFQEWDAEFCMEDKEEEDDEDEITKWVKEEVETLASQMLSVTLTEAKEEEEKEELVKAAKRSLCSVLLFHYRSGGAGLKQEEQQHSTTSSPTTTSASAAAASTRWDPLLPPLLNTILSTGIPPSAASVVLANIMPVSVPLMALSASERLLVAKSLHSRFYLLACYHFPLLVLHLDRYCPGWHWPKVLKMKKKKSKSNVKDESSSGIEKSGSRDGDDEEEKEDGVADGETKEEEDNEDEEEVKSTTSSSTSSSNQNATKKQRNIESQGIIPMSWFVSHLAGECGGSSVPHKRLLPLWDVLLTTTTTSGEEEEKKDASLTFFLALSILEKHSDMLLMLRGEELGEALKCVMELKESEAFEGNFLSPDDHHHDHDDDEKDEEEEEEEAEHENDVVDYKFVQDWCARSKALVESTPNSVVDKLRNAEDEAINKALIVRQKIAEEKLQARLEAEAKAHKEAMEAERIKKEEEARSALTRARLVIYYKQHNPEKVKTVDKILNRYDGRIDELDAKLKKKYGPSFLPPVSHMTPILLGAKTNRLLSSMNQGISTKKKQISQSVAARRAAAAAAAAARNNNKLELEDTSFSELQVALKVSPEEIMPTLCSTKVSRLGGVVRGDKDGRVVMRGRYAVVESSDIAQLKFYLIDSRPDEDAKEQGRFPTSISLSPESLMDPDKVQQHMDMFESLRGAVHICVMGEGFSSFPSLYGTKLSDSEKAHAADDEARTSMCALFFIKKGFPFVSILDGGFAAAHAWLSREGREKGLTKSANLVDYDEDSSLFGQLETTYREQVEFKNASAREKAKKLSQKLLDNSMTRLTMTENRLESVASELSKPENRQKVRQSVSTFFEEKKSEKFKNPFASLHQKRGENEDGKDDSETNEDGQGEHAHKKTFDLSRIKFHTDKSSTKAFDLSRVSFSSGTDGATQKSSLKMNNPFAGERKPFSGDRNPFGSFGKKETVTKDSKVSETKEEQEDDKTEASSTKIGTSLKRNPFAGLGKKGTVTEESETKDDQKTHGGPLKRNPFASIGSKALVDGREEGAENANKSKGTSMLRKNPFASIASKGSFDNKESGKDGDGEHKSGTKTEIGSMLRKNPFASIASKGSFDNKEGAKKDANDEKSGAKSEIGSMLKRNPFASIGAKIASDDKGTGKKNDTDLKDGTKKQNSNPFGVFGLEGKELYKTLSKPPEKTENDESLSETIGKSFQGISAMASSSIMKPEGFSAQEESISFADSYEDTDESATKQTNIEKVDEEALVYVKDKPTGEITKDTPPSGPLEDDTKSSDAEVPALFPVFPVRNSFDPTADLFDIGGLTDDATSEDLSSMDEN